jgi:hypothetical protein
MTSNGKTIKIKPSWLPLQHVFPQSNQVTRRTKYMWWEVCPLLEPIGY